MAFQRDGGYRVPAHSTLTELDAISRAVAQDAPKLRQRGISIVATGADVVHNVVEVDLENATEGAQATLQARYGPHVVTVVMGSISEDAGAAATP
jgi:hypothetical protein